MNEEATKEWWDALREFESCDAEERLLRFHEVFDAATRDCTIVEKGYWLKYDPTEHPERVSRLNWLGTPLAEMTVRSPTWAVPGVWLITTTVREASARRLSASTDPREASEEGRYYDEQGDPFDPDNAANWDGGRQVGFRD